MKQILRPSNYERLQKFIGDPDQPFQFKSLYTAIVWSPNDKDVSLDQISHHHIIVMNKDTPKFQDDYFFYRWLRTSSKTLFGSGKMVRSMDMQSSLHFNFHGNDDMEQYSLNYGTQEKHKQKQFIISQHLTVADIQKLQFFKSDRFQSTIFKAVTMNDLQGQEFQQFKKENEISIAPFQPSVRDALIYTMKNTSSYPVMIDLGPQVVSEVLDLIEYMVLTLYRGSLQSEFIGGEMPKMSQILDLFHIVFESEEMKQHLGFIKVYVLIRKT